MRITEFDFPDREIAVDLELLAERADVAKVLDSLTKEWLQDQIRLLEAQAAIVKTIGFGAIGGVIGWSLLSIVGLTTALSEGNNFK